MFKYILSSKTNYPLLICDDAGPGYALNMNWASVYLDDIHFFTDDVAVVDPRVNPSELEKIEQLLSNNRHTKFFFRIADPSYEINKDHFYYNFLVMVSKYQNAYLLSTYEPRGIVSEIKKSYPGKFIHLPYPYLKKNEVNPAHRRENKITLSGSINEHIYPYRSAIWRRVTRSPVRFLFFKILKHPGYIDLGQNSSHTHSFVKDQFINFLSRSKYMLMCPSVFGIELLKFNECAYAGCIPVGQAPDSYPKEIKDLFLQLRPRHLISDVLNIIFKHHDIGLISNIREFLRNTRNPDLLNHIFEQFIITAEQSVNK